MVKQMFRPLLNVSRNVFLVFLLAGKPKRISRKVRTAKHEPVICLVCLETSSLVQKASAEKEF